MQIRLLKWFDRMSGGFVAGILPAAQAGEAAMPLRFLLIRPGGIGDAVLLIPAILAIKEKFHEAEISVLAERRNGSAFALCPVVDHLHLYDTPSGLIKVILGDYDVVIDTEQWYRLSAIVARLIRAPQSIGFATNERARLFTHPVSYAQEQYEAYSFFRLLEPLGIAPNLRIGIPFLELPSTAFEGAEKLIAPLSGRPFVTIFPGASTPQKQWGTENFRELTALLAARGIAMVVVGGEDTRRAGEEIARDAIALNLAGRASLAETAALIEKGSALVSGDSGLLHIAAGLGTPTVSLFGPSDPRKWGPKGVLDLVFGARLPCAPCSRFGTIPPCEASARCMASTTPLEVAQGIMQLLDRLPNEKK